MADHKYGKRSKKSHLDIGVRDVAPTYGRPAFFTSAAKVEPGQSFLADGHPESLTAEMLQLDPMIHGFEPQPLTVDLVERRLLFSKKEREEAKKRYAGRDGRSLYTPDFGAQVELLGKQVIEVKLKGYEGDDEYLGMLDESATILANFGYGLTQLVITNDQTKAPWTTVPYLLQASLRHDLRPTEDLLARIDVLAGQGACTGRDFIQGLGILPGYLYVLITTGALRVDPLLGAICGSTPMAPAHGDLSHLHFVQRLRA